MHYCSIDKLLTAGRNPISPTYFGHGKEVGWSSWLQRVAAWRLLLQQHEGQKWALYHTDAGEFSAILFALWSLSKIACLPGNRQPAMVQKLATQVDGFVGDYGDVGVPVVTLPASEKEEFLSITSIHIADDLPLLEICTSGSSGEPQGVQKTLYQLNHELMGLENMWGDKVGQSRVLATVGHQHIYGLLFRVLWPLAAGRCFDAFVCEYLEEISQRYADHPFIVVSSPSHLSRIHETLSHHAFASLRGVFSSGAPLSREHSLVAKERLSVAVTEVYGSTETGGIAWRERKERNNHAEDIWQIFSGIDIDINKEGCLQARSPRINNTNTWFDTADCIRIVDANHFVLLGRNDRLVKIEGKRVSLEEMEAFLRQHDMVEDVHMLVLEKKRIEIGAVVVLSASGKHGIQRDDKNTINKILRNHLLQYFDRPVLPRRWRYVSDSLHNQQGKIEHRKMMEIFINNVGDDISHLPLELERIMLTSKHLRVRLKVPDDLIFFDGHFDKHPVLPGVTQIYWVHLYAEKYLIPEGEFSELRSVKFQDIIFPNQEVILEVRYNTAKRKITFSYSDSSIVYASGNIIFTPSH